MPNHLLVYVGVVVAIALLPGPDTAVVTKNALIHGREAALGSAIGVNVGLSVWTLATALGVAAILRSSATVYDALKLIGALYLSTSAHGRCGSRVARGPESARRRRPARSFDGRGGFVQGVISNLANPKVGDLLHEPAAPVRLAAPLGAAADADARRPSSSPSTSSGCAATRLPP